VVYLKNKASNKIIWIIFLPIVIVKGLHFSLQPDNLTFAVSCIMLEIKGLMRSVTTAVAIVFGCTRIEFFPKTNTLNGTITSLYGQYRVY